MTCPDCAGACGELASQSEPLFWDNVAWLLCDTCHGTGVLTTPCPYCRGSGVDDPTHP
jgi:DnaJ-class molecular chaperone